MLHTTGLDSTEERKMRVLGWWLMLVGSPRLALFGSVPSTKGHFFSPSSPKPQVFNIVWNIGIKAWNVDAKRVVCNLNTTEAFPSVLDLKCSPVEPIFVSAAASRGCVPPYLFYLKVSEYQILWQSGNEPLSLALTLLMYVYAQCALGVVT